MRNTIIFGVAMTDELKPLATQKTIATFTLTASHKNTQDLLLSDGKSDPTSRSPRARSTTSSGSTWRTFWSRARAAKWSSWSATAPSERSQ